VETSPVTTGPLKTTVNEEGKTRIKQRYSLSAPVAGQLRRIPFKAGAPVVAHQTVIATIDPLAPALLDARARSLAEARRDNATANLEKSRAAYSFASSELRRYEKLHSEKAISIQELESTQYREAAASREKAAAESVLREAEAELALFNHPEKTGTAPVEIHSPITGRILRVREESERVVSAGTPLADVGDPTDLEVVVEVLSRDGAIIAPGTAVDFEQWGGSEPLAGQVRLVEPAAFTKVSALGVEEQRVNVVADFLTPPEKRGTVGDNFRVEAKITVWETNSTLKVPVGALFRHENGWAAFVITNEHAALRAVKAGHSNGIETEILDGLKPVETLILYPGDRVKHGQRVKCIRI
jgi:HlyD family secretion protein